MDELKQNSQSLNISKKITKIVGNTNATYNLIEEGDKVLVGFSGGKDSLTLIHALKRMQGKVPFHFEFKAVTLTYGMGEQVEFLSIIVKNIIFLMILLIQKYLIFQKRKLEKTALFVVL